jgi:predicted metal-dependent hydrolase
MLKSASIPESGFILLDGERVGFSVVRSKRRRKTVAFKVERDGTVLVLAPIKARLSSIEKILQKRATWIVDELQARRENIENDATDEFTDGAVFRYLGHRCTVRVTQGGDALQSCRLLPRVFHVHVPDDKLSRENLRQEVKLEMMLWVKKRARVKFKKRLDFWADRLGVRYKKLIVTNPERRWGSCSVDNIIRLNWRLMMTPLPILDYVVAHELCHVRHKNHSPRFWGLLGEKMTDYRARRKVLRSVERGGMI